MKKMRILSVILVSFFFASCNSDSKKTSLENENLKGKVKTIKEYWLEKKEASNKIIKILAGISNFNNLGFITESSEYSYNDSIVEKISYKYDENNNIISKQAFSEKEKLKWKLEYSYNVADSTVTIYLLASDSIVISATKYRYIENEILNPINESKYQSGEKFYNEEGNLMQVKFHDQSVINYKYSKNLLIEVMQYDTGNKLISKEIYRYDNFKNQTEKRTLLASGKAGDLIEYKYLFDNEKNWVQKKEYLNHKLVSTIERVIEYY